MLHQLSIRDFAIVDRVDLDLDAGMTAITGETGAGKSLLIGALHLLLGGRADAGVVRAGAREATVSGLFSLGSGPHSDRVRVVLERVGIVQESLTDERDLLVRRNIATGGRSKAFLDDVPVTVATLREVMRGVVDIMSQHEHLSLASREQQRDLLDAFGEHGPLRLELAARHQALGYLLDEHRRLAAAEADKTARIDYLEFQLRELQELQPQPGEAARLVDERRQLASVDKLRQHATAAESAVYGDDRAALTLIDEARKQLRAVEELSPELARLAATLGEASALVGDAGQELGRYLHHLEGDPERLQSVEDRLDALRQLARKHACEPDELAGLSQRLGAELDELQHAQSRLADLDRQSGQAREALAEQAQLLSTARHAAADKLAEACRGMLGELAMATARVEVVVGDLPMRDDDQLLALDAGQQRGVAAHGADRVEFLLQANPGEPARPLNKVASGGELSRVALALRRALAGRDPVPTYVFDEVDAAIGGATAEAVGLALKQVSATHQVLCITHLPQVASLADQQLQVEKLVDGERTHTGVRRLEPGERVDELARMLGGAEIGETARKHARSLLKRAQA